MFTACAEVWLEASRLEGFGEALPVARLTLWQEVCGWAFETTLEAMVRAKRCSKDGRIAMNT